MEKRLQALFEYIKSVGEVSSIEDLTSKFAGVVEPFGFQHFACSEVARVDRPIVMRPLFGSVPVEWASHYFKRGYTKIDPALKALFRTTQAFTWSEVEAQSDNPLVTQMFGEAREVRGKEALVVPVHGAQGQVHVVIMSGDEVDLSPSVRPSLRLAAIYFAELGIELTEAADEMATLCPLTDRQLECLKWASDGKSDWETGAILGISENTVHRHIEFAKRTLGVNTRIQAAMIAWRRNWLHMQ